MQVDTLTETRTEYQYKTVRFILTPKYVAVATSLQFFILKPAEAEAWKKVRKIRRMIEAQQIKGLSDLAEQCTHKVAWMVSREDWLK